MNFWNNPEHDSLKTIIMVVVVVLAGFFVYKYLHVNGLDNSGRVVNTVQAPTVKEALPSVPASVTLPVTQITATSAVFTGKVSATDQMNTATPSFMYGTTPSYGQTVKGTVSQDGLSVTATATGLTCHTTYYYRTVATNPNGRTFGAAQKFTTLACASLRK
ncbi:MAG: hypothetical protein WCG55_04255 [bacterium]